MSKTVTLRLDDEVYRELKEAAAAESRPLSNLIEYAALSRIRERQFADDAEMAEMRIPVLDQQGELAAIATLAADLDVNIYDLEIAHSAEGPRGVVVVLVELAMAERFQGGLMAKDAVGVLFGRIADPTVGSTHYHATHASPKWAAGKAPVRTIGRHFFYNDID